MASFNENAPTSLMSPTVHIVEDDESYAKWIAEVLGSADLSSKFFTMPSEFLEQFSPGGIGCIVLDVKLPEMSGLELHKRLLKSGVLMPVIMITAYGEVADAVEAIRSGAVDYIQKPVSANSFLERVERAINVSIESQEASTDLLTIRDRLLLLTPRERQVLDLLVEGRSTKDVAMALEIGLTTVDFHRNNVLQKMQVEGIVDLAHLMVRYEQLRPYLGTAK